jgi:hypothetical protein
LLERAGAVDFFGGKTQLFGDRKLGGDAAASFSFAKATGNEALELLLRLAPGNDEPIEFFVNAGFDQKSGFHKGGVACASALPFGELTEDDLGDVRMNDGVKTVELGAIVENDGAEFCAVDIAAGSEHGLPEFPEDLVIRRISRLDEPVSQGIGVEDGEAHFAQHGSDGAFAAGDSTGEAESQHDRELSRAGGRLRCRKFGRGAAEASGFHGVAHQHGDGHGADAAGNRSERAGGVDGAGMDIAEKSAAFGAEFFETVGKISEEALGFFDIGDAVGANVNDRGAGLDPVWLDAASFAHSGDDDIGAAEDIGKVARFGMTNGDGGVGVHEEKGHGFADNIAAAEDDGVGAFDLDFVAAQNFHAAGRSASDQAGTSADETAEIDGMEAIDVFGRIDCFENTLGIDLRGKRELDENAVDVVGTIEVFDDGEQVERVCSRWRRKESAGEAELFAGCDFTFYVKLRGRIVTDENSREARASTCGSEQADFIAELGKDLVPDFVSVKDACGHARLTFDLRVRYKRK